jgi:putative Mg2+ transporter-C (MgtC) family protein
MDLGIGAICMRLACAMAVGMIIGTEREYTNRPAGLRTHILVALDACVVTVTGQLIFFQYQALGASPDPARLSAQVITGVGFLGAGTILRDGANVRGLTTAASLWAVACLGIASGAGYYSVALAGMILIFITLTIFEVLQVKLIGPGTGLNRYKLETTDVCAGLQALHLHAQKNRASLQSLVTRRTEAQVYEICFQVEISGTGTKKRRQKFLESLASDPAICAIHSENTDTAPV